MGGSHPGEDTTPFMAELRALHLILAAIARARDLERPSVQRIAAYIVIDCKGAIAIAERTSPPMGSAIRWRDMKGNVKHIDDTNVHLPTLWVPSNDKEMPGICMYTNRWMYGFTGRRMWLRKVSSLFRFGIFPGLLCVTNIIDMKAIHTFARATNTSGRDTRTWWLGFSTSMSSNTSSTAHTSTGS